MSWRYTRSIGRQHGLSLATALFVITVLALLAVMIFQLVRNSAEATGEEITLIRAFYAAETGTQFGANAVFPPDGTAGSCAATTTYPLTEDGLAACSAVVQCMSVTVSAKIYYTIRSTGTCGDVSRTVQVRAQ